MKLENAEKNGMKKAALNGKWLSSSVPYGYRYDKQSKTLIVDQSEAETVRYVYYLFTYLKESIAQMVDTLNNDSLSWDRKWTCSTVRNILKNRVYKGDLVIGKRTTNPMTGKRIAVSVEEQLIILKHHEAIISEDLFNEVQWLLAQSSVKRVV